jgi:hypothetical protein
MTIIHNPPNTHRIDAVWAAVSVDDGGEGLCAVCVDGAWVPLLTSDETRLEWVIAQARLLARRSGKRIKIIKLCQRIEVADIAQFGSVQ